MDFSLVHLSDIHIEDENDLIIKRLEKLKMACVSVLPANGNVLIVVSGDIANKGKETQYALAKQLFDELRDCIEEKLRAKVFFAFAPGNHDCDFALDDSVRKALLKSVKNTEVDKEYFSNVVKVQKPFVDFVNHFSKYDINKLLNLMTIDIDGNKILVVIANTAWMSEINENPGNLVMPESLLMEKEIDTSAYKCIFYVFHHPTNWFFPDKKRTFINHIRKISDFVLVGHEHERDSYETLGDSFSVVFSKGKELQDRNSPSSGFSIYVFDAAFQNYSSYDFSWSVDKYIRINEKTNQLHKNLLSHLSVFCPTPKIIDDCEDMGVSINHFAKDDVKLSDLFTWPDVNLYEYGDNNVHRTIRDDFTTSIDGNKFTVMIGATSEGKTSIAKKLFLCDENKDICCVLLDGSEFNTSNEASVANTIENKFVQQYSPEFLEEFRQLPAEKRAVIIDNFDYIKNNNNRRTVVLDYLYHYFGKITIFLSTELEIATIINSELIKSLETFYYYEILPLGNRKRKQLISKWYHLNNLDQTEEEINEQIEKAQNQINSFLGNGATFVPAIPVFVISTLQNSDAQKPSYENTKFGFLYESLILNSIAKVAEGGYDNSKFNIDSTALSFLAFDMLKTKRTSFLQSQLDDAVDFMNEKYMIKVSSTDLLKRMITAKIIYKDLSDGECYRFKYPYIFYYFAGRYISKNLTDKEVQEKIEYMSSRLYNETYGNIIIFVCHFANSKEIIENVLLNAYSTLDKYEEFEFSKSNPIFDDIKDSLDSLLPKCISENSDVPINQEKSLMKKDEMGINDGRVVDEEDYIDDDISEKEKEVAEVASAFKTMEVLGQILQNYPTGVEAEDKIDIIDEIHRLGMRSVNTLVNTLMEYKNDFIEYAYEKIQQEKKNIRKEDIIDAFQKFLHFLVSNTARSMIHQVAKTLDNEHLLGAATASFSKNQSISAKLVLLDLKINCLKKISFNDIQKLRKSFSDSNELFAMYTLDSIVGSYLNYNKCNPVQREKLCSLCGFSKQKSLIETHKNIESEK